MKKIFSTTLFLVSALFVFAQDWFPVGNGLRNGNNRDVDALVEFNGKLIAGGAFEILSGNDTMVYIAQWDGNTWKQMGPGGGFSNYVNALAVFNGELYAGGDMFRRHNDDGTKFVGAFAKWDGAKWMPVAGLENGSVYAMTVYDNKLILARREEIIDQNSGNTISSDLLLTTYDGNTFTNIPGIFKGPENYAALEDMCVYDGNLIIVGRFDSINNLPIRMVASWDGTNWGDLDFPVEGRTEVSQGVNGIYGYANACAVYDDKLFVGGLLPTFNFPNSAEPTSLASYDGANWVRHQFDENVGNTVRDLLVKSDTLFVIGEYAVSLSGEILMGVSIFEESNTPPFIGTGFYPTSDSQGSRVNTGVVFNNALYVGGNFQRAGSNLVNNIARFDPSAEQVVGIEGADSKNVLSIYPNPANTVLNISSREEGSFDLKLSDITGKVIFEQTNQKDIVSIDVAQFASGMYLLSLSNSSRVHKIIIE